MRILVPLAEGFEEIEAVTIVDVLRRADLEVTLAGLAPGPCRGSRGVVLQADALLEELDPLDFQAIVLPGGMGGTLAMAEHEGLLGALRIFWRERRWIAAICAAPLVLSRAGIVEGVALTAHPGVHEQLGAADLRPRERLVVTGRLITSQGPGTSMEFALGLVEAFVGPEKRSELAAAMVVAPTPA